MKIKKIILIIALIVIVLASCIIVFKKRDNSEIKNDKLQVVVSNFASYDFIRAIVGESDNVELTFLLGAGKDIHSYEPTANDLIKIQNSDLFVYVGGEAESWTDKVLSSLDTENNKIICIADFVDTIEEQEIDGAEEEEEEEEEEGTFDEHIWTSPANAIKMIDALQKAIAEINPEKTEEYKQNADNYIAKIQKMDKKVQEIVDQKVRDRLVFADKMPMQYFIQYYDLQVTAAFSGCSTETEPSASTIAYIEDRVKEEQIPVVLYIELNDGRIAKTIADEVGNGTQAMQIQTLHNVSLDDFQNGETWVSLMERNLDVLRKALL